MTPPQNLSTAIGLWLTSGMGFSYYPFMTTTYYVLCQCGTQASELTHNGVVCIYTTKKAANQAAAHMRLLMEGGPRTTYTVKAAR